jgi:mono/diheme cytochrome c family protein
VFFDEPRIARIVAPNIARIARAYSPAEFEAVLRHGVRPNGTGVAIMPSQMFANFTDADVGSILAFLKSLTPATDSLPATEVRIMGRIGLATGQFRLVPQEIENARVAGIAAPAAADSVAPGRYMALTTCTECHGPDLRGGLVGTEAAPNLAIVKAYSRDQFVHLLRTGEPIGNRTLKTMAEVAQARFTHFTDDELSALHRYLQTLPGT